MDGTRVWDMQILVCGKIILNKKELCGGLVQALGDDAEAGRRLSMHGAILADVGA